MYIRIAFSIELRLRVSRSLRSLANYRPSQLAQTPSNDVLACGDPITPSNTVKYHPSSNTLISTEQRGGVRNKYIYIYIYVYVKARVGVKFGINFTSVRLSGNKIARGEAECYLPLNLTRVKFVPEISRLTVLLKINTIASLLFI